MTRFEGAERARASAAPVAAPEPAEECPIAALLTRIAERLLREGKA